MVQCLLHCRYLLMDVDDFVPIPSVHLDSSTAEIPVSNHLVFSLPGI